MEYKIRKKKSIKELEEKYGDKFSEECQDLYKQYKKECSLGDSTVSICYEDKKKLSKFIKEWKETSIPKLIKYNYNYNNTIKNLNQCAMNRSKHQRECIKKENTEDYKKRYLRHLYKINEYKDKKTVCINAKKELDIISKNKLIEFMENQKSNIKEKFDIHEKFFSDENPKLSELIKTYNDIVEYVEQRKAQYYLSSKEEEEEQEEEEEEHQEEEHQEEEQEEQVKIKTKKTRQEPIKQSSKKITIEEFERQLEEAIRDIELTGKRKYRK